jgi:hypothetical protein
MLAILGLSVVMSACVTGGIEPIVRPTPPGPGWTVHTLLKARVAIALPDTWIVVEIQRPNSPTFPPTQSPALVSQLTPVLTDLTQREARLFAYDPSTPIEPVQPPPFPAMLYLNAASSTQLNLDEVAKKLPTEPPGRTVIDSRRLDGAAGNRLVQRIREVRVRPDGTNETTIQVVVLLPRGGYLNTLVMQVPESVFPQYAMTLDQIATSFAPF